MNIGSTSYYRLSGGKLRAMKAFDRSTGCPSASKVQADEVAVWRCENWDGRTEIIAGSKVQAHCRRKGVTVEQLVEASRDPVTGQIR